MLWSGTTFRPLISWLRQLLQNTVSNFPSGGWGVGLTNANLNTMRQVLQAYFAVGLANFGFGLGQQTFNPAHGLGTAGVSGAPFTAIPAIPTPALGGAPFTSSSVSASVGQASTLGRLSVPAGWQGATAAEMEEDQLVSAARPVGPQSNGMLNGIPMSGNAGLGAGLGRRGGGYVVKYGVKHPVMPRPPAGG
jgi:hypothetical protein